MTSGPENLRSMFDHHFMELVCEKGQLLVKGSPSSTTRSYDHKKTPSFITSSLYSTTGGYGLDTERDARFTKKPRLDQTCINVGRIPDDSRVTEALPKESNRLGSQCKPRYNIESDDKKSSTGTVNFSNFMRPVTLLKSIHDQSSSQHASTVIKLNERAPSSNRFIANNVYSAPRVAKPDDQEALPDERYEAFPPGYELRNYRSHDQVLLHQTRSGKASEVKAGKSHTGISSELLMVPSSSDLCSMVASNDPTYDLRRRSDDQEVMEESAYSCHENVEEELNGVMKAKAARRALGRRKFRSGAEVHNLSKRKRRVKINKKMRMLQELIPNCNKTDKASTLDEAIEYLKTLQLQLQIMSMGSWLRMPQMMLPNGLPHFSSMAGAAMAMRALAGSGRIPQFPTNHHQVALGLPMSVPLASFPPPHYPQSNFLPHILRAPNLDHQGFSPLPVSKDNTHL